MTTINPDGYNANVAPDGSNVNKELPMSNTERVLKTKSGEISINQDSIAQAEVNQSPNIRFVRENGNVYIDLLVSNPSSPQLSPPKLGASSTTDDVTPNTWFNGSPIVALWDAFAAMYLALQKQKRLDKMIELNLANVSYQMSEDSAKLRIDLGKIEQMEHIMGAVTTALVGVASAAISWRMPHATEKGGWGAGGIATMELAKGTFQSMGEAVKAFFAMPKATTEAAKIIKDAANQLILANKESAAQAAKEGQDELNRVLQQLSDIIQRYKDAMKMVQA